MVPPNDGSHKGGLRVSGYPERINSFRNGILTNTICSYADVGVRGGRSLRRTALRFEGVASPPVRVCAGPILQVDGLRP